MNVLNRNAFRLARRGPGSQLKHHYGNNAQIRMAQRWYSGRPNSRPNLLQTLWHQKIKFGDYVKDFLLFFFAMGTLAALDTWYPGWFGDFRSKYASVAEMKKVSIEHSLYLSISIALYHLSSTKANLLPRPLPKSKSYSAKTRSPPMMKNFVSTATPNGQPSTANSCPWPLCFPRPPKTSPRSPKYATNTRCP